MGHAKKYQAFKKAEVETLAKFLSYYCYFIVHVYCPHVSMFYILSFLCIVSLWKIVENFLNVGLTLKIYVTYT